VETKPAVGEMQLQGRIKWILGENVMMQLEQDPGRRKKGLELEKTAGVTRVLDGINRKHKMEETLGVKLRKTKRRALLKMILGVKLGRSGKAKIAQKIQLRLGVRQAGAALKQKLKMLIKEVAG
jgi:hypothetical protein